MERTERISIGHYAFTMDKEAYTLLKEYMTTLENHYLKTPDGAEIMDSVEARIAELLYERRGSDGVVTGTDIREIIGVLGYPETEDGLRDTGVKNEEKAKGGMGYSRNESECNTARKRLYRDMQNRKICGVCSGIGKRLGFDPIWLRLGLSAATLVLMFSSLNNDAPYFLFPSMLYIVLCFCIPKAVTVKQRCEMRGENGTVDDINRYRYESGHERTDANYGKRTGCLGTAFGIILLVIGIFGLFTKLVVFGSLIFAGNMTMGILDCLSGFDILTSLLAITPVTRFLFNPLYQMLWAMIFIIPSVLIIYGGAILVFDITTPKWRPGLCILGLWLLLLIGIIPATYFTGHRVIKKIEQIDPSDIPAPVSGNVYNDFKEMKEWLERHNFDEYEWSELDEWLEEHNFYNDSTDCCQKDSLGVQFPAPADSCMAI